MSDVRIFNWLIIFGGYFLVITSVQLLSEDQVRNICTWTFSFQHGFKRQRRISNGGTTLNCG